MKDFLSYTIFTYNNFEIEVLDVIYLIFAFIIVRITTLLTKRIIFKYSKNKDKGSIYASYKILSYLIWIFGFVIYLNIIGVDITLLIAGSAALLVGVGIGLQQTFNDLISGFILLFEGSIKIGDIVIVDGEMKKIRSIGLRTSKVVGYDDVFIIIPNSKIVTEKVINYSHSELQTRFAIDLGVAYGSDTEKVKKILLECANNHPLVDGDPTPFVIFKDFGNSSLDFRLGFWTTHIWECWGIMSDIRFEIDRRFRENGVTIPFPQRDLHIKTPIIYKGDSSDTNL